MDDKTIMATILSDVKGACDLMMHGSIESSTADVHATFRDELNRSLDRQSRIYAKMSEKGWYPSESVDCKKIEQTKQKFSSAK